MTADLLTGGVLEPVDQRISDVVSGWGLRDSAAYPAVWAVTQVGAGHDPRGPGRPGRLPGVAAADLGAAAARPSGGRGPHRRVYAIKHGTGRTAPGFPGAYFFHDDGASFPSGHVANAVIMWGVARWLVVDYRLPAGVQRASWWLSVFGPVATGVAMVSLDFHWATDAVAGAAVGIVLLGVVHALDAFILSRWVRARLAGRPHSGFRGRLLATGGVLGAALSLVARCPPPPR